MSRAMCAACERDSGLISIVEPVCGRRAEYRGEVRGRRVLCGVGFLERTRVKSGSGSEDCDGFGLDMLEYGEAGATKSSRHSFGGFCGGMAEFAEVVRVGLDDVTDWNTWIGRASKNSWATMNGVELSSSKKVSVVKYRNDEHTTRNELNVLTPDNLLAVAIFTL